MVMNPMVQSVKNHPKKQIQDKEIMGIEGML